MFPCRKILGIVVYKSEKDFCLDTGICKKGLEINTEHGLIEINKENCEKYGWEWREKGKVCNMRDKD